MIGVPGAQPRSSDAGVDAHALVSCCGSERAAEACGVAAEQGGRDFERADAAKLMDAPVEVDEQIHVEHDTALSGQPLASGLVCWCHKCPVAQRPGK